MTGPARPVGGRLLTPTFLVLLLLAAAAAVLAVVRFTQGLGAVTALSDGYPWGLWIAFDVVVGTGIASGGYAVALVVYLLDRRRLHPLLRPAILTSALGYALASAAVVLDVGRYWVLGQVPALPWRWNGSSVLLEVALCMTIYLAVLAVELAPAVLERWIAEGHPRRAGRAARWLPRLHRALPLLIAAALVLPTMHQSSLGALLLVAGPKLHPLWHTPLLPLLFLLGALAMGHAVVVVESVVARFAFARAHDGGLLGALGAGAAAVLVALVGVRIAGLAGAGRLALTITSGRFAALFWAETGLLLGAAWLFWRPATRAHPGTQLQAALLALAGGALHRLDAFLLAFDPGPGWHYFPSLGELIVTLGLLSTEAMVWLWAVRRFPILAGGPAAAPEPAAGIAASAGATP